MYSTTLVNYSLFIHAFSLSVCLSVCLSLSLSCVIKYYLISLARYFAKKEVSFVSLSVILLVFCLFFEPQLHADLLLHFFLLLFCHFSFFLSFFLSSPFFFFVVVLRSSLSVLSFCVCFWSNSYKCTVPHKRI